MTTQKIRLTLFIAGYDAQTQNTVSLLEKFCSVELKGQAKLAVIDLLEHPGMAGKHKILCIPTLIQETPSPPKRFIGDFADEIELQKILSNYIGSVS
ncbi:circadian clock KaiB family protein [Magnetococcales bacterium HHB-1]